MAEVFEMRYFFYYFLPILLGLFCLTGFAVNRQTEANNSVGNAALAIPGNVSSPKFMNSLAEAGPTAQESQPLDKNKRYNILFIGNSYTTRNNMPRDIFRQIAISAGYDVAITSSTKGGWYLDGFANANDEMGKEVDALLKNKNYKFDFVVMQEQSVCPAATPKRFYNGVRGLYEKIRAHGAIPILYETWGRKTGEITLRENGWTNESMTWKLAAAYYTIGRELDIDVAYAGLAFFDVYTNHQALGLYDADGSHPSYMGSYLAALTIFAEMFHYNPADVSYIGTLSAENAAILREAARKAVYETPEIPRDYLPASEEVSDTSAAPETTASETTAPVTTVSETTVAETTVAETTGFDTTAAEATTAVGGASSASKISKAVYAILGIGAAAVVVTVAVWMQIGRRKSNGQK